MEWDRNEGGSRAISDVLRELWGVRNLLASLTTRDIRVKARQSFLGLFWPIMQPLLTALIFLAFFNGLAGIDSDGTPYLLFAFIGTSVWNLVSSGTGQAAESLIQHTALVGKVYFPRAALPVSACLTALFSFAISSTVLAVLMIIYRVWSGWPILTLPLWILGLMALCMPLGMILSAMNVRARDVGRMVSFGMQLWLWLTPVAYPTSLIEDRWGSLAATLSFLNPVAGLLEGLRWSLIGTPLTPRVWISAAVTLVILVVGLRSFARLERGTADFL